MNMYSYTNNDPVNKIDPSGLKWVKSTQTCVEGKNGKECATNWKWVPDEDDSLFGGFPTDENAPPVHFQPLIEYDVCEVIYENPLSNVPVFASANFSNSPAEERDFKDGVHYGGGIKSLGLAFGTDSNRRRFVKVGFVLEFTFTEGDGGYELSNVGAGLGALLVADGEGLDGSILKADVNIANDTVTSGADLDIKARGRRTTGKAGLQFGGQSCN